MVLVGTDAFLRQQAQERLAHQWLQTTAAEHSEPFDLRERDLAEVLQAAACAPLLAKRRLLVARPLEALPIGEHPRLLAYLQDPVPTSLLVLCADKLDARWKLTQALRAAGAIESVQPLTPREAPSFVQAQAAAAGMPFSAAAAAALVAQVGPDAGLLLQSVHKIALHQHGTGAPSPSQVQQLVAPTREASIFALTDALATGPWAHASVALQALLRGGEEPLVVLAMLVRQVRLLLAAQQKRPLLGVPPFVADQLKKQAPRLPREALLAALADFQRCDRLLKGSRLPAELVLERAIWPLCRAAAR